MTFPIKGLSISCDWFLSLHGHSVSEACLHEALASNPTVQNLEFPCSSKESQCFGAIDGYFLLQQLPDFDRIGFSVSVTNERVRQSLADWISSKNSNNLRKKKFRFFQGNVYEIVKIFSEKESKLVNVFFSNCYLDDAGVIAISKLLEQKNNNLWDA